MRLLITAGATSLLAVPAMATELELKVEIPKLEVAEYHRPYVAVWLERTDNSVAANLAVWYDVANKKNEGDKWLKDLRQWWRRAGRDLKVPADGLTGATRPAGTHTVKFDASHPALKDLAAGEYQLVVEAAREEGGREVVRIPVSLGKAATLEAKGQSELGALSVSIKP
jgi:hypothetical protein